VLPTAAGSHRYLIQFTIAETRKLVRASTATRFPAKLRKTSWQN
jgi:hypothetical protein